MTSALKTWLWHGEGTAEGQLLSGIVSFMAARTDPGGAGVR
ncbi:hypothetical protein ACFC09_44705 [Streptomyces sp. NPDC056161]